MIPKDARFGTPDRSVLHEAVLAQGSRPSEKRRGSWSFLTWSFFLAQTIAAEKFFGSGARAADNDDAGAARSNDQSHSPSDDSAAAAVWGPGSEDAGDGRILDPQASLNATQGLLLPGVSEAASDYSAAGSTGASGGGIDSSGSGSSSGADQSHSSQAESEQLGDSQTISLPSEIPAGGDDIITPAPGIDDIITPTPGIDLGIDIGPDLNTDLGLGLNLGPVAEAGVGLEVGLGDGADLALDLGLGSPLADVLGLETDVSLDLNLLGGDPSLDLAVGVSATSSLLNASVDHVTQEAMPGEFVTSVVSSTTAGLEPLQQVGAVSSGDVIAFSGGAATNLADDLFTSGRYTDYGLALHTDGAPGLGSVTHAIDSDIVAEGPSSLLDTSEADAALNQSRSSIGDNLDTSHFGFPSSVDELARNDTI